MNLNNIIDRLSDLKITYRKEKCPDIDLNGYVTSGTYDVMDNNITMYEAENFENCDIIVLTHEFGHVFQNNSSRFAMELSNELFARETLRRMYDLGLIEDESIFIDEDGAYTNFGSGYNGYMYLYYRLAEMMSQKALREYQFTCDEKIIISALADIDKKNTGVLDSYITAYKFLNTMDEMRTYNTKTDSYDLNNNQKAYKKCCEYLDNYYKKKNGTDPVKDLNNVVLYDMFETDELIGITILMARINTIKDIIGDEIEGNYKGWRLLPKTYLSNDHPNQSIILQKESSKENVEFEITDKIREKYKENYAIAEDKTKYILDDSDENWIMY